MRSSLADKSNSAIFLHSRILFRIESRTKGALPNSVSAPGTLGCHGKTEGAGPRITLKDRMVIYAELEQPHPLAVIETNCRRRNRRAESRASHKPHRNRARASDFAHVLAVERASLARPSSAVDNTELGLRRTNCARKWGWVGEVLENCAKSELHLA